MAAEEALSAAAPLTGKIVSCWYSSVVGDEVGSSVKDDDGIGPGGDRDGEVEGKECAGGEVAAEISYGGGNGVVAGLSSSLDTLEASGDELY